MAEVKPNLVVLPERLEAHIEAGSYVLMSQRSFDVVFNSMNLRIISSIAKGITRFSELLKATSIPKGQLSRHLRALIKEGWISRGKDGYNFSASVYVVVDVEESNGSIMIKIRDDRGAFIDPIHGLVIFRDSGISDYCSTCPLRALCTRNVKDMAKKYGIKLHSAEPAEAYMEVFRELVRINLLKRLRSGSLNLKPINTE